MLLKYRYKYKYINVYSFVRTIPAPEYNLPKKPTLMLSLHIYVSFIAEEFYKMPQNVFSFCNITDGLICMNKVILPKIMF